MRASSRVYLLAFVSGLLVSALAGCGGGSHEPELGPIPINRAPTVSIVQPASNPCVLDVTATPFMDITVRAEDPDGDKLNCAWTWDAGSVSPDEVTVDAGTELTVRFTPPDGDGLCILGVTVSDGEASASESLEVQVTGYGGQPSMQLRVLGMNMSPDPVMPSARASISVTVDNPRGNPLTYVWKTKHGAISDTGSTIAWTAPRTPGIYTVYCIVSDGTISVKAGKAFTVAGPTGGLLGQYFTTTRQKNYVRLDELRLTRIDPQINFNWEKLSPDPGTLPGDGWGARWTGFLKCEQPGVYVFRAHVDDGARMTILNDAGEWFYVIPNNSENWSDHTEGAWLPEPPVPVQLDGGKWYPIELEYFEGGGDAFIVLYWSINGGPETIVPQEALRPPN